MRIFQPNLNPRKLILTAAQATTSGTVKDFTGIPSWVTETTVYFHGVSTDGINIIGVQIGDAAGFVVTGYLGSGGTIGASGNSASNQTTAFVVSDNNVAAAVWHGVVVLRKYSSTIWMASSHMGRSDGIEVGVSGMKGTLPTGPLTQVRVTSLGTPDNFDAGEVKISYR